MTRETQFEAFPRLLRTAQGAPAETLRGQHCSRHCCPASRSILQNRRSTLRSLFPYPVDEVRLEIGFGGGEHLIGQAQAHPRIGFIGDRAVCQWHGEGARRDRRTLAFQHSAASWRRDRACWHGSRELRLRGVDLLYPDPWPKRRHWKRRFVQDANIAAIARVLRPGGEFRFATDIADYAAWTLRHMLQSRFRMDRRARR